MPAGAQAAAAAAAPGRGRDGDDGRGRGAAGARLSRSAVGEERGWELGVRAARCGGLPASGAAPAPGRAGG